MKTTMSFGETHTNSLAATRLCFTGVLMAGLAVPTLAAEQIAPKYSGYRVIEEIVVSARKREETQLSTPVTMTALSADQLNRYQADDLSSIGAMVPSIIVGNYKTNGGGSITMRGISTPASQIGFEQAVSVAIDGVQSSDGRSALLGFFDLGQVEVLKGPQSLFFGKNSVGGVIALSTANPTEEFEVSTKLGYEFEAKESVAEVVVSGPLTDQLGARLALRYRDMDGWLHNDAGAIANPFYVPAAPAGAAQYPGAADDTVGEEELLSRFTLAYENDDGFSSTFKLSSAQLKDAGTSSSSQNIGPCADGIPRMFGAPDSFGECRIDDRMTSGDVPVAIAETFQLIDTDGKQEGKLESYTASLEINQSLGELELSSLSGFNSLSYWSFAGFDQTSLSQLVPYEDQKTATWSQELRLTSNFDSALNFMVGAYYQQADIEADSEVKLLDAWYSAADNRFIAYEGYARQDGKTLSAFGQLIWDVSDTVEIAGGLRWTHEEKDMRRYNTYGFGPFNTTATTFAGSDEVGVLKASFEDNNVSPEITFTWRPDADHTYYIAYKTGYKSGGYGLTNPFQVTTTLDDLDFDSEEAKGFEIGAKALLLDGRLSVNSSAFMFTFDDLQVSAYNPDRVAFTISNAGSLDQRGADLDFNYQATERLAVHGAIAYVKNRYEDFVGQCYSFNFGAGATRATAIAPDKCGFVDATSLTLQQDFDGRAPARSPELTGNLGLVVDIPLGPLNLTATLDALYSDDYFASETMAPTTRQDSFWRYNLGLNLADDSDRWGLSLIVKNLSDEFYLMYAADRTGGTSGTGIGEQRGVVSRGREMVLQARYNF